MSLSRRILRKFLTTGRASDPADFDSGLTMLSSIANAKLTTGACLQCSAWNVRHHTYLSGYQSKGGSLAVRSMFRAQVSGKERVETVRSISKAAGTGTEVVIALGSNVGDRVANLEAALQHMQRAGIAINRHSCLYESAPAYVTDQPFFLNAVVEARTDRSPLELLSALKAIEKDMGRRPGGIRFGPRPLDLDIIFYGSKSIQESNLEVPHPRMLERPFVLAPVVDLLSSASSSWAKHPMTDQGVTQQWERMGGEKLVGKDGLRRVIPLNGKMWSWTGRTHIMGIVNVTPDSFSDGGKFFGVEAAVAQARAMAAQGADFVDIGGQSTRPNATRISTQEEIDRVLPVIETLAADPAQLHGASISIDTFDSQVAEAAVAAGGHIVNDVSGGSLDPAMLPTIRRLGVPYILMHMRGDPTTMQDKENLEYEDVCEQVGRELAKRASAAEEAGVPAWRIITDPGIGFAKDKEQNLELIRGLRRVRSAVATSGSVALGHMPMLVGPSRKGFLGRTCDLPNAEDRDYATAAAVAACIAEGASIVRAHNVPAARDAARLSDALWSRDRC